MRTQHQTGECTVEVQTEETPTYTTYTRGTAEPLYCGDDFNEAAASLEMGEDTFNDLLMSDDVSADLPELTDEERAAMDSFGPNFVADILAGEIQPKQRQPTIDVINENIKTARAKMAELHPLNRTFADGTITDSVAWDNYKKLSSYVLSLERHRDVLAGAS